MDPCLKKKQIFFQNLLVLGLDKETFEKERSTKCDKNMFDVPNQKMFDAISHFLFTKLGESEGREYELPWPIFDGTTRRTFQKLCFTHLTKIAQESDVSFPKFTYSLLVTGFGNHFYNLYFAFSTHVVKKHLIKLKCPSLLRPKISTHNFEDAKQTVQILTMSAIDKFQEVQTAAKEQFEFVLKLRMSILNVIERLKSSLMSSACSSQQNVQALLLLYSNNTDMTEKSLEDAYRQVLDYEAKVKSHWKQFENFLAAEEKCWSLLQSEVEENNVKYVLEGAKYNSAAASFSGNQLNIEDSRQQQLNILEFLRTFLDVLKLYSESIKKGDLTKLHEMYALKDIKRLSENLNTLQIVKEDIGLLMPSLLMNIKTLQEKQTHEQTSGYSENFQNIFGITVDTKPCTQESTSGDTKSSESSLTTRITDSICQDSLLFGSEFAVDELEPATKSLESINFARMSCSDRLQDLSTHFTDVVDSDLGYSSASLRTSNTYEDCVNSSILKKNVDVIRNKSHSVTFSESDVKTICTSHYQLPNTSLSSKDSSLFDAKTETSKFKMRESWHFEESLNAMTLSMLSDSFDCNSADQDL